MKNLLIFITILTTTFSINAQSFEAGLAGGVTVYNGDLDITPTNFYKQMLPVAGVFGRYYLNSTWVVRGQAYLGQVTANEKLYSKSSYRKARGFSFSSPITELSIQGEFHALKLDRSFALETDDPFLTFYSFGGGGISMFDPKTDFNEPNPVVDNVSIDKNAKFSKTSTSMIGGAGVKMQVTDQIGIGFEVGGRKIFTDYLDGISKLSGKASDYYFFNTLTLTYKLDGGYTGGNWNRGGGRRRVGCPNF